MRSPAGMGSLGCARDDRGWTVGGCGALLRWTGVEWPSLHGLWLMGVVKELDHSQRFLFGLSILQLHEVICAHYHKDHTHGKRELFAGGIVDDGRMGQVVMTAAGLELASAGGQDILDPLALAAVGKGDRESVGRAKDVHRSVIKLARFSSHVSDDPEEGKPACELAGDAVGDC
jgi:hypothetical protein